MKAKSILLAMLIFFVSYGVAEAKKEDLKTFNLSLDTTGIVSSVSPFSGTSPVMIDGLDCVYYNSTTGDMRVAEGEGGTADLIFAAFDPQQWMSLQVNVLTGIAGAGADNADFDFYLERSLDVDDWSNTERFYFWEAETISGETNWAVDLMLPPGYYRPRFVTGTTSFTTATFKGAMGIGELEQSPAITFDEQHSAFTTSGVSNDMTSGGTGFTLPNGAKWFGFFAKGDDVPYSTDDTDASTSGLYFPDGEEKILPRSEVRNLGTAANGSSSGTLTMTPYSRRPY